MTEREALVTIKITAVAKEELENAIAESTERINRKLYMGGVVALLIHDWASKTPEERIKMIYRLEMGEV